MKECSRKVPEGSPSMREGSRKVPRGLPDMRTCSRKVSRGLPDMGECSWEGPSGLPDMGGRCWEAPEGVAGMGRRSGDRRETFSDIVSRSENRPKAGARVVGCWVTLENGVNDLGGHLKTRTSVVRRVRSTLQCGGRRQRDTALAAALGITAAACLQASLARRCEQPFVALYCLRRRCRAVACHRTTRLRPVKCKAVCASRAAPTKGHTRKLPARTFL